MNMLKKILSQLGNPKWFFLLPITIIGVAALAASTVILTQSGLRDYVVLGLVLLGIAVVALSYSIFGITRIYPGAKDRILKWSEKHPRINNAFSEYGFTTLIATGASIIITLAFAVYNSTIGFMTRSLWFGALAAYYLVLIVLRGIILTYYGTRKKAIENGQPESQTLINDSKLYRTCGVLLFLLPLCLSFAILQMVIAGDSFEHKGITIYVYALYAFSKIITAIYSLVKEHRNNSMVIMATKNVKLADAMVSILALQTAMFREFGGLSGNISTVAMNAVTGAIVCALTVALGIYMIVSAHLRIKKLKEPTTTDWM